MEWLKCIVVMCYGRRGGDGVLAGYAAVENGR